MTVLPLDLAKPRFERVTKQGTIIADSGVILGAGVFNDDVGKPHPCIHVLDPGRGGERLVYVLTPDSAQTIAGGLLGSLQRVNSK